MLSGLRDHLEEVSLGCDLTEEVACQVCQVDEAERIQESGKGMKL